MRRSQLGFSGGASPAPQMVPISPMDDGAAERERLKAEATAQAEAAASGRASTLRAGGAIAAQEQMSRGLLAKTRRADAAKELLG